MVSLAARPATVDVGLDLPALFPSLESARCIGSCYLTQYPEKTNRSLIMTELGLPVPESAVRNRDSLRKWVRESQQHDFATGNTVVVNHWILSRTEANLCALVALS